MKRGDRFAHFSNNTTQSASRNERKPHELSIFRTSITNLIPTGAGKNDANRKTYFKITLRQSTCLNAYAHFFLANRKYRILHRTKKTKKKWTNGEGKKIEYISPEAKLFFVAIFMQNNCRHLRRNGHFEKKCTRTVTKHYVEKRCWKKIVHNTTLELEHDVSFVKLSHVCGFSDPLPFLQPACFHLHNNFN